MKKLILLLITTATSCFAADPIPSAPPGGMPFEDTAQTQVIAAASEISDLKKQLQEVQRKLADAESEHKRVVAKLDTAEQYAKNDAQQMHAKIQQLTSERNSLQTRLNNKELENRDLRNREPEVVYKYYDEPTTRERIKREFSQDFALHKDRLREQTDRTIAQAEQRRENAETSRLATDTALKTFLAKNPTAADLKKEQDEHTKTKELLAQKWSYSQVIFLTGCAVATGYFLARFHAK